MWWIFRPGKEITAEECVQAEVTVELRKHRGRMLHELLHVPLQQLVQSVHTDVMARAAPQSAPVIGAAGVRGGKVAAAHGKHRAAAVAALEKAGIHIVVYLDAAIMALCALFPQSRGGAKVRESMMGGWWFSITIWSLSARRISLPLILARVYLPCRSVPI